MIDPDRLARAVHLLAVRTGPGLYRVTGGRSAHDVLAYGTHLACACADATLRSGVECKHRLAVRLRRGDPETLAALRALVPMPKRHRRKARAT